MSALTLSCRALSGDQRAVLMGQRRLDQLCADVGVARLGDVAASLTATRGILARHQAGEGHERAGERKPPPVTHLGGKGEGAEFRQSPVGAQASHWRGELRPHGGVVQVPLERVQVSLPVCDAGPVVRLTSSGSAAWAKCRLLSHLSCVTVHAVPVR